jgi:hypothetical protein
VGNPPKNLGEDDAGVSPGAQEGAVRDPGRDLASVVTLIDRDLVGLFQGGAHRQHHVGAGVAIRNWKDVQGVDGIPIGAEPLDRDGEGRQQTGPIPGVLRRVVCRSSRRIASGVDRSIGGRRPL